MTVYATPWGRFNLTREAWEALPLYVRLGLAACLHLDWVYGAGKFPYRCGAIPANLVNELARTTNCSTFTTAILSAAYPSIPWTIQDYQDLQIYSIARPLSPIEAVARRRVGEIVEEPVEGKLHLVQGWRTFGKPATATRPPVKPSGHSFVARREGDLLRVLQVANEVGPKWSYTTIADVEEEYRAALGFARLLDLGEALP